MKDLRSYLFYVALTWKQEMTHRREFLIRFFLAAANSLTLFFFWIVYVQKFDHINGWTIREIAVLYATTHMVMGWLGLFGVGSLDIAQNYFSGRVTQELSDPGYAMARVVSQGVSFHGVSSLVLGLMYFTYSSLAQTPSVYLLLLLVSALGAMVMTLFFCVINSLVVRFRDGQVIADQAYEIALLFMMYPKTLFSGLVYALCVSVIPVFWMVHYPAQLIIKPELNHLLVLMAVLAIALALATWAINSLREFVLEHGD